MTSQKSSRRQFLVKQQARLEGQLADIEIDLETVTREEERSALFKKGDVISRKIDEIESEIKQLDSESPDQNVRDRSLEKRLQRINFAQAKETATRINEKLDRDGGSVLFFLQKSQRQMGHYCLEEVIDIIIREQKLGDQIIGYRRFSIDLSSAVSECNEFGFLRELASYFEIQSLTDSNELSQQLREKLRDSLSMGTTTLLEIKSLDDLLEKEEFMGWFVEEFWKPFVDDIETISKQYKSKFIVALIADSQILPDCSGAYFCSGEAFDCYKILELPLPDWTIEDIHTWLIRSHSLLANMKGKSSEELMDFAKKIHRASDGTPGIICNSLREKFLCQ